MLKHFDVARDVVSDCEIALPDMMEIPARLEGWSCFQARRGSYRILTSPLYQIVFDSVHMA